MLKVRSARNGEQRSKGGSAKRRLESLFAGMATASLLVTGLAGVAAADPVDETPQSDPAATETTANQGTEDDSVGNSEDAQSSDQDLNNGSDEGIVSQSGPGSNAARSVSPLAAGERNDKVVMRDILLDRVPAGSGQLAVGDTAHISAVWDATEADPKPGEYFTVTLPEEFSFLQDASGFPLKGDDADGNEQTWANCTLETATRTVTCTSPMSLLTGMRSGEPSSLISKLRRQPPVRQSMSMRTAPLRSLICLGKAAYQIRHR